MSAAAALLLLLLAGPRPAASPGAAVIAQAKAAVTHDFLDPGSAQFRGVRVDKGPFGPDVCGEVNGKNRFGAYVGFRRFAYRGGVAYVEDPRNPTSALAVQLNGPACQR